MEHPIKNSSLINDGNVESSLQRSESSPKDSLDIHDVEVDGFREYFHNIEASLHGGNSESSTNGMEDS